MVNKKDIRGFRGTWALTEQRRATSCVGAGFLEPNVTFVILLERIEARRRSDDYSGTPPDTLIVSCLLNIMESGSLTSKAKAECTRV